MGYIHIESLYKCPQFFENYKEIYALEKIHGTSTWIIFQKNRNLLFHSGGENGDNFKALFDIKNLEEKFLSISSQYKWPYIKIHGEAYGGKQQGMSKTYGSKLKFIGFEVFVIDESNKEKFLDVPDAEQVFKDLSLEFVSYVKGPNTFQWIEEQAAKESIQAIRNGIGEGKSCEGIVVKPLTDSYFKDGKRAICKHKNADFWEIKSRRPLGEQIKILENTLQIVEEWLTINRFEHVIDRVLQTKEQKSLQIKDIKIFLELIIEDIKRESENEIVWSDNVNKAIRKKAGEMFRNHICNLKFEPK